jgi:hypothetical protein
VTELDSAFIDLPSFAPRSHWLRETSRLAVAGLKRLFAHRQMTGEELERAIAAAPLKEEARRKVDRRLLR